MSSGGWVRVGDPTSRSWSPARLSGACGPAGALSAAVRKDLNLNLSAVHENIRSSAYGQRFRIWFRVKASGSIGPMCSSRAQLPAPRPSSAMSPAGYSLAVLSSNRLRFADCIQWWGSFRLRSTGKTSQPSAGGRRCCRQNRQKCGRFIPALTNDRWNSSKARNKGRSPHRINRSPIPRSSILP
jgi:hypothetical protein